MLVGGDDIINDVSSIFYVFLNVVYIHPLFRFALIGGNLTAQTDILQKTVVGYIKQLFLEPEGRMGYWLRGHEGEWNNCFSKIRLVGQNIETKQLKQAKRDSVTIFFGFQSRRFSLLVGYNI